MVVLCAMDLTSHQRTQYKDRFFDIAKKYGAVKNGSLDYSNFFSQSQSLVQEIKKNAIISDMLLTSEISLLIFDSFIELRGLRKDVSDFTFREALTDQELEGVSEKFVKFIEGLPYLHDFYFRIPIDLPEAVLSIKITDTVQVIAPLKTEGELFGKKSTAAPLVNALLGLPKFEVKERDVLFKISLWGHGQMVQAQAVSIFKQFLYLGVLNGILTYSVWEKNDGRKFESQLFHRPVLENGILKPFSLHNDHASFVSGVKLNFERFNDFKQPVGGPGSFVNTIYAERTFDDYFKGKFQFEFSSFSKLLEEVRKSELIHVRSAIEWGFDGAANGNRTMGFIQTCIGLEALLGDKKHLAQASITAKLADRCAFLLGKTPSERQKLTEQFLKIYDLRSKLVHGVSTKVKENEDGLISEAEHLLKRLVHKEIWLVSNSVN